MEVPSKNKEGELDKENIRRGLLSLKIPQIEGNGLGTRIKGTTLFLIENSEVQKIINKNPKLKGIAENLRGEKFRVHYNEFMKAFSSLMLQEYRLFLNVENEKGSPFFTEVEPFEDPKWKSTYNAVRKPGEPGLINGIAFYRRKASMHGGSHGMTIGNNILLDIENIDAESQRISKIPWKNTIGFFGPNNFKYAVVANELASVAFDSVSSDGLEYKGPNGKNYTKNHISEFYSDVISSRVDIRDMRRIVVQSLGGQSHENYLLTNDIVRKYLQDRGIRSLMGQENDIKFLSEVQKYIEAVWEQFYKNMQSAKLLKK